MAILKQKVDSHVTFLGWYGTCGNCENFDLTNKTDTISTIYQFSEDGVGVRTFSSNAPTFLQSFTELVCGNSYWIILKPGTSQIDIENFVVGYFGGSDLGSITSSCNENNHETTPTPTPVINCPADTFQCPDGSYVSRNPDDDCKFYPCPSAPTPTPTGYLWQQIGQDIDGEIEREKIGTSVSLNSNGNIVAIGESGDNLNGNNSGHVRIYQNINGTWTQIGDDIDRPSNMDEYFQSVSLNSEGNIVAVGTPMSGRQHSDRSDQVQIYQNINETWTQIGGIGGNNDFIGFSVSLNSEGNIVAFGSYFGEDDKVRVYQNISETWTQIGDDIDMGGRSVSLNSEGNIVAIGHPGHGKVRIYQNVNGNWTQLGDDINGEVVEDVTGRCVSLNSNGNIVAIGSEPGAGQTNSAGTETGGAGCVRVYEYKADSSSWIKIGDNIEGESDSDHSGASVSLNSDGNIVAIGAPGNDDNGTNSGHVRIYQNINGTWTQKGGDIDGEATLDNSGSVSLSSDGSIVAIGAATNDGNDGDLFWSGSVRVYKGSSEYTPTPTPATASGRFQPKSKVELLRAIGAYENTHENALKNYGNVSTWDVSKITDMKELFANRRLLQTYDLSNWDVSNVVTMAGMFFNTKSVSSFGNLDKWNVGRVKTMSGMFNHSHHLTNIGNIENWNIGSVVKMNTMFTGCKQLKFIGNINKWQTNSLKETAYMFYNSGIQNINVSDWDVSNVTVLAGMFARTSVETLDLKNWNVSNVINLSNMFENATKLTSLDLSNWNVSKVRELHFLFFNTPKLTNVGNLSNWCVRNITSPPRRFAYMSPWYNNSENRPVWGTCPNSSDNNTDEPDREETEDSSDIPPPPGFGGYADFPVNEDLPYGEI